MEAITALTRAFLEAEGFDPNIEIQFDSGIAEKWRKVAEIAVETLKGIGWDEVEPYRRVLQQVHECRTKHQRFCGACAYSVKKALSRSEVDA